VTAALPHYEVRTATLADPLTQPLLQELAYEYRTRYASIGGGVKEMSRYPAWEFEPAHGGPPRQPATCGCT
jgi:hypothetical protein